MMKYKLTGYSYLLTSLGGHVIHLKAENNFSKSCLHSGEEKKFKMSGLSHIPSPRGTIASC
jgi:hypothetical protein